MPRAILIPTMGHTEVVFIKFIQDCQDVMDMRIRAIELARDLVAVIPDVTMIGIGLNLRGNAIVRRLAPEGWDDTVYGPTILTGPILCEQGRVAKLPQKYLDILREA